MKTQHLTLIVLSTIMLFLASLYFAGCSASEETEQTGTGEEQPAPKPLTKTDTVKIMVRDSVPVQVIRLPEARQTQPQNPPTQPEPVTPAAPTIPVFTVQIGAFQNSQYAEDAHRKAMQQFSEPAFNEYDSAKGFYRVTVGNFKTKAEALDFRQTCVNKGYKDAWVIEAQRTVSK